MDRGAQPGSGRFIKVGLTNCALYNCTVLPLKHRSETQFKMPTSGNEPTPGIDARHIFLQLDMLKETAAKLEQDQIPKTEAQDPETKIPVNSNVTAPLFRLEDVEKLGLSVTKAARPVSTKWLLPLASVFSRKVKQPISDPVVSTEPTYPPSIVIPVRILHPRFDVRNSELNLAPRSRTF